MPITAAAETSFDNRGLPFQIRGSLQTIISLRLLRPDDPEFYRLLLEKVAHAPDFFRNAPLVIDAGPIATRPPDALQALVERLRQHRLVPVGLQNGSPAWNEAAAGLGLALFGAGSSGDASEPRSGKRPSGGRRPTSMVVREPVRGGQQIINPEGDVIILAPVSTGSEIVALGHIHVYAPLRGRAFAGMEGDEASMIFCDHLEAELVSIAGFHMVNEEIAPNLLGKRARALLRGKRLVVEPAS